MTTKTQIKKKAKQISDLMGKLKKEFFVLEILQSKWESEHGTMAEIKSPKDYINSLMKEA